MRAVLDFLARRRGPFAVASRRRGSPPCRCRRRADHFEGEEQPRLSLTPHAPLPTGSSRWFVMGAVVFRKATEPQTVKLNDAVRAALNYSAGRKPLHFVDLRHEHRVVWIDHIARASVRVSAGAAHQPSLKEPETFQQKSTLYRYATRYLLERVSWCRRDYHKTGGGDGSAEVVFSHR